MYKTEIDLDVARPHKKDALRLAHKDSSPALSSDQRPAVCVTSPVDSTVRSVGSRPNDPAGDIHNDSGVKVETKSIGNISALITRFNGVESRVLDDKLPVKQFRIDLRNVLKSHDTACEKSSESPSGQGDKDISIVGSQSCRLPVVQLNGKLYTETAKPENVTLNSDMSATGKQFCVLKIPPKPAPKPKDTKKSVSQTAVICPANNEQSVGNCVTPSNLQLITPFAVNDIASTNNTGTFGKISECEHGRRIHIQAGICASGSSQREHKLNPSKITDSANGTVMLPKGSRDNDIHRERLSTEQPREENLKGSITDSWQEGQQETTTMKPTVLSRHVGISLINHEESMGKLSTNDFILGSVVTLDMGTVSNSTKFGRTESKTAAPSVSNDTSCHEDVVEVTEECKHLRKGDEKVDFVISKEKACDNVKNEKDNPMKSNAAETVIKLDESRNENMTGNCIFVFDCNDPKTANSSLVDCKTSTDPSDVGCKTSTDPSGVGCKTSTDPSGVGCKISTGPSFHDCTIFKEPSAYECTASTDSGVFSSTTSTDSRLDGCETSTDTHGDACQMSTESSAGGCSTSAGIAVDVFEKSLKPSAGGCTPAVSGSATSTGPCVPSSGPSATSKGPSVAECSQDDPSSGGDTITAKLDMLKSELMAMRKMDLVLLRQLININQAIQHIHRSDLPKVSRSLTFLSSRKNLQPHFRPVERQNSAPHCADRRRFLFSNVKWKTEDDYRDSLSSFDESEIDSPSELEESTSSLNNVTTNLSRSGTGRRILFQSRNIPLPLDISEDSEHSYEDILQRNVRLWKMGFQRHQSLQERVDVWF
ncbi:hypothetical protein BsWGS_13271 [Bradybaena similaris]